MLTLMIKVILCNFLIALYKLKHKEVPISIFNFCVLKKAFEQYMP